MLSRCCSCAFASAPAAPWSLSCAAATWLETPRSAASWVTSACRSSVTFPPEVDTTGPPPLMILSSCWCAAALAVTQASCTLGRASSLGAARSASCLRPAEAGPASTCRLDGSRCWIAPVTSTFVNSWSTRYGASAAWICSSASSFELVDFQLSVLSAWRFTQTAKAPVNSASDASASRIGTMTRCARFGGSVERSGSDIEAPLDSAVACSTVVTTSPRGLVLFDATNVCALEPFLLTPLG